MSNQLTVIQKGLKAPKGQYNNFGKYKYRSCEDILEAVKPLLSSTGTVLILTDDIELVGDRYYVRATARLIDAETGEVLGTTSAYAREDEAKKGMDGSQITGTASSYARKYALNGLFLIDDTKDNDTDEYKKESKAKAEAEGNKVASKPIGEARAKAFEKELSAHQIPVQMIYDKFSVPSLKDVTEGQMSEVIGNIDKYALANEITALAKSNQLSWFRETYEVIELTEAKVSDLRSFLKALKGKQDGSQSPAA